jgi:hypothetical protein
MADQQQGPGPLGGLGGMLGGVGKAVGGTGDRAREEMAMNMIMQVLRGLKYPLGKADLAREAQQRNAPPQLTEVLGRMPDRQYMSADDVAGEARKTWQMQ